MRTDAFLALTERLPVTDLAGLIGDGGLVVVAPHPDDESLGCGGLLAQAQKANRSVRVVVLSDGCGSHPRSRRFPPPALGSLREAETRAAMIEIGLDPAELRFLRLPDASVPRVGSDADAAAAAIAEAVRDCDATAIATTWEHDPHCDHEAAAAIVDAVAATIGGLRSLRFIVWGWTLPPETEIPAAPDGYRLDVGRERATKRRAVMAHASQTTGLIDDPPGFRLPDAMIDRMCGPYEHYLIAAP